MISETKLVEPGTRVVCLGVLIDSIQGTISIPEEKLQQVNKSVHEWLSKNVCTKRQLQSILGLLLYVHKCVKPACVFLNHMLELLRASHNTQRIVLTPDFKHDLRWFTKFLSLFITLLFPPRWTQRKVRVRCDNQAVLQVLRSGRTKDPFLAVCARNILGGTI